MTAKEILAALAKRHEDDVFVAECKDGPTWTAAHMRMDAWAMKRSWSHPGAVAYEIKVSRSDFLGDKKWPRYLQCCNEFYFVCPKGLIAPDEAGDAAGLIWVVGAGKLITKKKAPWRNVQIPDLVYRYVLMSRSKIVPSGSIRMGNNPEENKRWKVQFFKDYLDRKEQWRTIGHAVSRKVAEHVRKVEAENEAYRELISEYDEIVELLKRLGFRKSDGAWNLARRVGSKLDELTRIVPPWFEKSLTEIERAAAKMRTDLERAKSDLAASES